MSFNIYVTHATIFSLLIITIFFLHFNFLLSFYLYFFSYLYEHTCSIVKNLEFGKYSVKENLENMECWRFAWLSC